jgi:hypothetical protein
MAEWGRMMMWDNMIDFAIECVIVAAEVVALFAVTLAVVIAIDLAT